MWRGAVERKYKPSLSNVNRSLLLFVYSLFVFPRNQEANPIVFVRQSCVTDFEPIVLTYSQCVQILLNLNRMNQVLVITDAVTALRISGILALRWSDIDWENASIRVRRAYVYGRFGPPKSKASGRPVPASRSRGTAQGLA